MSNPERQEVDLVVYDGDGEKTYTLKMSTAASIALQHRLKMKTGEIIQQLGAFDIEAMRDVVHSMLQKFHAVEFPTTQKGLVDVGEVMDNVVGGRKRLIAAISEAIGIADDKAKTKQLAEEGPNPAEEGPNPTAAQAGTGGDSTLRLAESA